MHNREEWLSDSLVELSDTLESPLDQIAYWGCLVERFGQLFPTSSVWLIADRGEAGAAPIVVSNDHRFDAPSLADLLAAEGPAIDCRESGERLVELGLDERPWRWPRVATAVAPMGLRSVHAFPLRRRAGILGAICAFDTTAQPFAERDMRIAGTLAHTATIAMLLQHAMAGLARTSEQLQSALISRVVIEQAKGMVCARLDIGVDEAFGLLRRYCRDHNLRMAVLAERVVSRALPVADLLPMSRRMRMVAGEPTRHRDRQGDGD